MGESCGEGFDILAMARTNHEAAVRDAAMAAIRRDPKWGSVIAEYLVKLTDGYYSQEFQDVLFQNDRRNPITWETAFAFGMIHSAIFDGDVAMVRVAVGSEPHADRLAEKNNDALAYISSPFGAIFHGGHGDSDGTLSWSERIRATVTIGKDDLSQEASEDTFESGSAPLEVGTTAMSRTWLHLARERCLARWPYGAERITLLLVRNEKLWRPKW